MKNKIKPKMNYNQTANIRTEQRAFILSHLKKHGQIATIEAHRHGILAPAARIYELRKRGHIIATRRDRSRNGMAVYIYRGGGRADANQ